MQSQSALSLLIGHQQAIVALLDDADDLLLRFDPSQGKALALLRWQLLRRLRVYQLFKHGEVFDPLIACKDADRAGHARTMKARCTAMGQCHADYVQRWSADTIYASWADYVVEAQAMAGRIRRHLAREAADAERLLRD